MAGPKVTRTAPTAPEDALHARGLTRVAGVDEAGRGPLAGPVVAAAVVFPPGTVIGGVYDSKRLSPKRREILAWQIKSAAAAYGIGRVSPADIDRVNILQATMMAMEEAVMAAQAMLGAPVQYALIDGTRVPNLGCPAQRIVKGDTLSHSIAAASILAKVERDNFMAWLDALYPLYGFAAHAGYGTRAHLAALREHGPCEAHRFTYKGVKPPSSHGVPTGLS